MEMVLSMWKVSNTNVGIQVEIPSLSIPWTAMLIRMGKSNSKGILFLKVTLSTLGVLEDLFGMEWLSAAAWISHARLWRSSTRWSRK